LPKCGGFAKPALPLDAGQGKIAALFLKERKQYNEIPAHTIIGSARLGSARLGFF